MHELSIAKNIVEIVEETLSQYPGRKAKTVFLKAGTLSNVVIESLSFNFKALVQENPLINANLLTDEVPVVLKCDNCGKNSSDSELFFNCKFCGSISVAIISGTELFVSAIELD